MSACVTSAGQDCFAALAMTHHGVGQDCFAALEMTTHGVIASAAKQSLMGTSALKQSF